MSGSFSDALPFLMTAAFTALLGYFTLRQPARPGKRYFLIMVANWLVLITGALLEAAATGSALRSFAVSLQLLAGLLSAPLLLYFTLEYTGHHHWLTRWRMALVALPAAVFFLLIVTNPLHHLVWAEPAAGLAVSSARGPAAWAGILYVYGFWVLSIIFLFDCMLRAPAFRVPIMLILLGEAVPRLVFFIPLTQLAPYSPIQLTTIAGNISVLAYVLALFNYRLLRVLPVARDAVLDRMDYSVVVLDSEQRLIDYNLAAQSLPELPGSLFIGQPGAEALGVWWKQIEPLMSCEPVTREITIRPGLIYQVHSLPLMHASGWCMGHVFVVNDVTPAWSARQQLARQQWVQATLQERQQLAQELHDGLSQNLAFLNVESQAAQVYLRTGQVEAAQACLSRLVEELSHMTGNTRDMIGDLMIASLPVEGFLITLRQVLAAFEKQSGTPVTLNIDAEAEAACSELFDSPMVIQLLRIVQEALNNIRKHAREAARVQVRLAVNEGALRISIADDGKGFTPEPAVEQGKHFGMRIMRQRAARIGAQFAVRSELDRGTQVDINIPINATRNKYEYSTG